MKRQSNIELLRIFSMLLIIAHHYVNHGGSYWCAGTNQNMFISSLLMIGGTLGVNIFVMITGYFIVDRNFHWKQLIKLETAILFYSIIFYGIACFVWNTETISFLSLRNTLLPTLTNLGTQYWFMPCYFALMLVSPFLNILIQNMTKEQYKKLLLILVILGSLVPTLLQTTPLYDGNIMVFIIMYLLGAYVAKFGVMIWKEKKYLFGVAGVSGYFILAFFTYVFKVNAQKLAALGLYADVLWNRYSIFIISLAFLFFLYFNQLKINYSNVINSISATTLGIYLIHDNIYVRGYLWNNILHAPDYYNKPEMVLHAAICIVVVFIVCAVIEYVRESIFELVYKWLNIK